MWWYCMMFVVIFLLAALMPLYCTAALPLYKGKK
jgi:hypothetical protein